MQVRIRLFAAMADAGGKTLLLDLPDGSCVADVRPALVQARPGIRWPPGTMLAVNMEYAAETAPLREGDEVAVIPPVSGG